MTGAPPDERDLQMLKPYDWRGWEAKRVSIGNPYAKDSSMWYWSAAPVSPGDGALGYVAELRRIRASPTNIDQTPKGFHRTGHFHVQHGHRRRRLD